MGIFYLGLLPSFWVRLRAAPDLPAITATIPDWLAGASFSPGALAKWWICLAIVSSDVGAYFGGKVWVFIILEWVEENGLVCRNK